MLTRDPFRPLKSNIERLFYGNLSTNLREVYILCNFNYFLDEVIYYQKHAYAYIRELIILIDSIFNISTDNALEIVIIRVAKLTLVENLSYL